MVTDRGRILRRPRQQIGLDALEKPHLAQHIASVVALSLQRNRYENFHGGRAGGGKQGHLASTLRLAEQNVSNMTNYLRRREAHAAAIVASCRETAEVQEVATCDANVCVICLEGSMATSANMREEAREQALPCGHVFHAHCIARWLQYRRVCPVDRRPVD